MAIDTLYTFLREGITGIDVFSLGWIIPLIFLFFCMAVITRNTNKWKILALPVTLGLNSIGIKQNLLVFLIGGLVFGVEALSLETIAGMINAVRVRYKPLETTGKIREQLKKRPYSPMGMGVNKSGGEYTVLGREDPIKTLLKPFESKSKKKAKETATGYKQIAKAKMESAKEISRYINKQIESRTLDRLEQSYEDMMKRRRMSK